MAGGGGAEGGGSPSQSGLYFPHWNAGQDSYRKGKFQRILSQEIISNMNAGSMWGIFSILTLQPFIYQDIHMQLAIYDSISIHVHTSTRPLQQFIIHPSTGNPSIFSSIFPSIHLFIHILPSIPPSNYPLIHQLLVKNHELHCKNHRKCF